MTRTPVSENVVFVCRGRGTDPSSRRRRRRLRYRNPPTRLPEPLGEDTRPGHADPLGGRHVFEQIHLVNFGGSVVGALVGAATITVGGVVFGTVYERTRNLVVPILAHGAYNTVLLVATFLTTRGGCRVRSAGRAGSSTTAASRTRRVRR
ncbi:lysostaphin resistance A-like protein [Halobaculum sp. MBLA0147]|uniref:CPBP family intramembrane glutamic endopeptidase n=1 Tax=Halobaculum sp. MBLA0147 TaxID=3079934 RepID=UPI0035247CC7